MRGTGTRTKDAVLVRAPAEDGLVVVSLATDLRADRFRGIAWDVSGLPEGARARVLWLSDANPGRMQSLPAVVEAGGIRPVVVADDRGWIGRIKGLGLSVSVAGPPPMPVEIRGVTAKPMGAIELLGDRLREWFAFEGWNSTRVGQRARRWRRPAGPAAAGACRGVRGTRQRAGARTAVRAPGPGRPPGCRGRRNRRRRLAGRRPALGGQPRSAGRGNGASMADRPTATSSSPRPIPQSTSSSRRLAR